MRKIYEGRAFKEITLDNMRKTIATRLSQAKSTIPHFYLRRDVRLCVPPHEQIGVGLARAGHGSERALTAFLFLGIARGADGHLGLQVS